MLNVSSVTGTTVTDALNTLYARSLQYLDTDDSPIALWNFNDTLAAVVGPTLSAGTGIFAFTDVFPGVRGLWLNNACRMDAPPTPNLILLGAMSCEMIIQMQTFPPNIWLAGVGGTSGSELQADNISWSMGLPTVNFPMTQQAVWEQGLGVDVSFQTNTAVGNPSYPFIHQIASLGMSRTASGVTQFYMDGKPFGSPSGALTLPDGGGSGVFTLGGQLGLSSVAQPMYISVAVYDRARSAAEFLASYNRSVGVALGLQS